jgi:curli biogenesis system outer membrane secretion channel CsgG
MRRRAKVGWAAKRFIRLAFVCGLFLGSSTAGIGAACAQQNASQQSQEPSEKKPEQELAAKLLKVRRIYVDSFGDDTVAKQIQAMVINALSESKKFIITEDKSKADAILKGAALEKTSQEFHASGDSTSVGVAHGSQSSSINGSNGNVSGSSNGGFGAQHMGTSDSVASTETINDARVAVRLVATDGDVIWTATKESKGAKYKGASADVADMIVSQLLRDLEKVTPTPKQ